MLQPKQFDFGRGLALRDLAVNQDRRADERLAFQQQQATQAQANQTRQIQLQEQKFREAARQRGVSEQQFAIELAQDIISQSSTPEEAIAYARSIPGFIDSPEEEAMFRNAPKERYGSAFRQGSKVLRSGDSLVNDSGEVLATGPRSAEDDAKLRKLEADATSAENKASESTKKLEGEDSTAQDVVTLTSSLLASPDVVKRVYGTADGLLPSLRPETVDAEADIRRLVNLLTLENTSKMSGVLSESDIQILASAGTVLSNFRISDEKALAEIGRIQDVFSRNPEAISKLQGIQENSFTSPSGVQFTVE